MNPDHPHLGARFPISDATKRGKFSYDLSSYVTCRPGFENKLCSSGDIRVRISKCVVAMRVGLESGDSPDEATQTCERDSARHPKDRERQPNALSTFLIL
jgi:hypothetical protein